MSKKTTKSTQTKPPEQPEARPEQPPLPMVAPLWLVLDPTWEAAEPEDVLVTTSVRDLEARVREGIKPDRNPSLYATHAEAEADARERLLVFALRSAEGVAEASKPDEGDRCNVHRCRREAHVNLRVGGGNITRVTSLCRYHGKSLALNLAKQFEEFRFPEKVVSEE